MRGRALGAAALLGLALTSSAGAHGGTHDDAGSFPTLPPAASRAHDVGDPDGRTVERRVRRIETNVLGRSHAIEHAQARALAARMRDGRTAHDYSLGSGRYSVTLQPDNGLVPPQVGGQWQASQPLPITAINAVQLHTGKILYFAYPWRATEPDPDSGQPGSIDKWDYADAYLYDPATGQSRPVPPPTDPNTGRRVELFCAGQSLMADGRVLITGGNVADPAGTGPDKQNFGLNTTYVFDPEAAERGADPWTAGPLMRQGRWYPSQVLMPDGRTVITSGQAGIGNQDAGLVNRDVEVFYPDGTLENLEDSRLDGKGGRPDNVGQYPHMLWLPGGGILNYGPFKPDVWRMATPQQGKTSTGFTDLPDLPTNREWAGGFQVPGGPSGSSTVMLVGGSDRTDLDKPASGQSPPLATTTFFDESRPAQGWQPGPDLNVPRAFANTVLLPTGKVAVVGGGNGENSATRYYRWTFEPSQRRVELLDPANPSAKPVLGNAQAEGRTYHSTALLLPDGRVWSAGDDINGPRALPPDDPSTPENEGPDYNGGETFRQAQMQGGGSGVKADTAEIWSPPYLFDGNGNPAARPQILAAPRDVAWGSDFTVRASGDATRAVLVAPGATTHAVDMSQRLVTLPTPRRSGSVLTIGAPGTSDVAPPGWYMLFLLNDAGTPSVASWVRVGRTGERPFDPDPVPVGDPLPASPPDKTVTTGTKRFKLGVRLSVPSTLAGLRKRRGLAVVATVDAPATVTVAAGQEVRRRVKGKRRTVVAPLAKGKRVTLRQAGARRVGVQLTRKAVRRLRTGRTVTLRIVVTAKPREGGKAVRVVRRPVLR